MQALRRSLGPGRKLLLISSSGGHLAELWRVERSLGVNEASIWVTTRNEQAESLLAGRRVVWVPYVAPRDVIGSYRVGNVVHGIVDNEAFDACLSAGAALAAIALPRIALGRTRTLYIESLARRRRTSLTGRIATMSPRVETWAQYPDFGSSRWRFAGSILDNYEVEQISAREAPLQILVTLGTIRSYRFDRAVDIVLEALQSLPDVQVIWQLGATTRSNLPGQVEADVSSSQMRSFMQRSDVVIGHAGVGTVLDALEAGRFPLLIPRSGALGEHIDSHQFELAETLAASGRAGAVLPGESITPELIVKAARLKMKLREESN